MEKRRKRGHLKIFFGYASGVGKTYTMLKAAHLARRRKIDVVVGYINPDSRIQTLRQQNGLEILPVKDSIRDGIPLREFDLDAALQRMPELILVDDLAHINGEGCRHARRYQDIEELLNQGIDVYTTVNVQHIESLTDQFTAITGLQEKERVPDSVFDQADQVELVDMEPAELIQRQKENRFNGSVSIQSLAAMKEMALRRCADRITKMSDQNVEHSNRYFTDEHILVCLSASPSNAKIIRTASRMANAFKGCFTALFVETPDFSSAKAEDKERLRQNMHLARQLGATIETAYGKDIALQISEFARLSGVSKIVLGRSSTRRKLFPTLAEKISQQCPNLDIYIIPDESTKALRRHRPVIHNLSFSPADMAKSLLVLTASTAIGFLLDCAGFGEANIITVYILGVLVTAVLTSRRVYSLVNAIISVLLFNYLFTAPLYTLHTYDAEYFTTFFIMLIAAFLTSSLAVQIKNQAAQSAETAYRTKILFDTNQLLASERDKAGIISVTCSQLSKLLNRDILFYSVQDEGLSSPLFFPVHTDQDFAKYNTVKEKEAALWVYRNNKHAGATTDTFGDSNCLYLSVRVAHDVFGVIGIAIGQQPLATFENSIMLSILGECALALKNDKTAKEREAAALLAKNEQLRADLLRSISHDLRTPLTSISGNAAILISNESNIEPEKRMQLYEDIYDDSLWLINLVENLLSVTRLEDGTMKLRLTTELLEEIVAEAMHHIDRRGEEHAIKVQNEDGLILVKADARLITQVLINLVDNAIKYTPKGSSILVKTVKDGNYAIVSVSDNGNGISNSAKEHLFEMFYTDNTSAADSRRSLGLGLFLCKSIVTAHGGTISVSDNHPKGAVFTFTLPIEEVSLHE